MAIRLTKRIVNSYARRAGVVAEPLGNLGWVIPSRDLDAFPPIGLTEHNGNVIISVLPLLTLNQAAQRSTVMEELLKLNARRPLIAYALEENWNILLWAVYPADALTYPLFEAGLRAIRDAVAEDLPALRKLAGE